MCNGITPHHSHAALLNFKAASRGLTYPRYVWIVYDWYPEGWWEIKDTDGRLSCDNEQMKKLLERAISFRRHPLREEGNAATEAGIVSICIQLNYCTYIETSA